MRHNTWGNKMEKMRTRLGYNAYHMRRWLRLLRRSRSSSSYPLPMSMLTPGGIDHNRASAKLESYIYRVYMVYAISSCLPHSLLTQYKYKKKQNKIWIKKLKHKIILARSKRQGSCYDRCLLESTWTWVKGMTTTIGCARVVSVSASCDRHCNLT